MDSSTLSGMHSERIDRNVAAAGHCYIKVSGYQGGVGEYRITIQLT